MSSPVKRLLLGAPIGNAEARHQRLSNPVALAVFSSDALSSVAYATEEILLALVVAGTLALSLALPIALVIGVLLVIVTFSYRQTIKAYPGGGGAYIVAHENLGVVPGLVAGGSLLVDYILTVAVSISAGTAAITSALPVLAPYRVWMAIGFVAVLAFANLRGVRESGALFAGPTFFFIFMLALVIVAGLARIAMGGTIEVPIHPIDATSSLTLFIVLKAFASGCTAMTGVEAIANGVQAFREPEARNARRTLTWMAGILLFLFIGTTALATLAHVTPAEGETVVSQLARGVFGTGWAYYAVQAGTAAILVIAANTAYADFPRLGSFMAGDGFLPKQLRDQGSRLVYSNGLMLLTAVSMALLVIFQGDTHKLIPLYAVGVFTSFTLSQSGMVVHWWRSRESGWRWSAFVNGVGALSTAVVLVVIATAKFQAGAWIVLVLIPVLVAYFMWVKSRYRAAKDQLAVPPDEMLELDKDTAIGVHNHVVLLMAGIDRRVVRAVQYVRSLKADSVEALFVDVGGDAAQSVAEQWEACDTGIPLTILESPYREIIDPIVEYVRAIPRPDEDHVVTVVLPGFVPNEATDWMLHDQTSFWIKNALFTEPGVIIADVPYRVREFHGANGDAAEGEAGA